LLSSSFDGFWLVLAAIGGAVAGVFFFFNGFQMLRYKRLILNTPFSKIHSASIGLVEVTGMPVGPNLLSAPITGSSCYYYRAQAWQWEESGKDSKWRQVLDESLYVPFFLQDGTGKVLIDPQGAEMDVHRSFTDEVYSTAFNQRGLMPANLRDFLVMRGLVPYNKIKLEERIIQPGFPLFIFGTLGENPGLDSWLGKPHVSGGRTSLKFDIDGGTGFRLTFRRQSSGEGSKALGNLLSKLPGAKVEEFKYQAPTGSGAVALPDRVIAAMNQVRMPVPAGMIPESAKSGTTAVAVEDGDAKNKVAAEEFNLHASAAISKGDRNEPFTISWRSQKEVVQSLAWKSTACIWGGPVLALICLYFLMVYFGWIL
jgi:hypothetical protein